MAMGQNQVPPVNIPIPTKIGSKMGGEFSYPKWDPIGFDPPAEIQGASALRISKTPHKNLARSLAHRRLPLSDRLMELVNETPRPPVFSGAPNWDDFLTRESLGGVLFPGFSRDLSLLEGNTPILINRGLLIRDQY